MTEGKSVLPYWGSKTMRFFPSKILNFNSISLYNCYFNCYLKALLAHISSGWKETISKHPFKRKYILQSHDNAGKSIIWKSLCWSWMVNERPKLFLYIVVLLYLCLFKKCNNFNNSMTYHFYGPHKPDDLQRNVCRHMGIPPPHVSSLTALLFSLTFFLRLKCRC